MLNLLPSARRIRRLNRRQGKKLRVGEFQEPVFEVRAQFRQPMDNAAHDALLGGFFEIIESQHLAVAEMGGQLPLMEMEGVVSAWGRGSPTEVDRAAVVDWLRQRPEVASAEAGELVDGWYGWKEGGAVSRSRRKSPIFGNTTARSEADDKRLWHKRWRSRERDQLASLGPDSDPLPVHLRAVSSTWDMAKDGKHWFDPLRQREMAERIAARRSKLKPERKALQARLLAKWRAK